MKMLNKSVEKGLKYCRRIQKTNYPLIIKKALEIAVKDTEQRMLLEMGNKTIKTKVVQVLKEKITQLSQEKAKWRTSMEVLRKSYDKKIRELESFKKNTTITLMQFTGKLQRIKELEKDKEFLNNEIRKLSKFETKRVKELKKARGKNK